MQEKTSRDPVTEDLEIVAHELRGVDDSLRNTICATTIDGPSNTYLRYRQPGLTKRAKGHLMIMVDEVVNRTTANLHTSYEGLGSSAVHRGQWQEGMWLNCGALVNDQGTPNQIPKSRSLLIGTFFTDDGASVVLGSYEGIVLNRSGMCMEMVGPGDRMRLSEVCRKKVIEKNTNSDTNRDL